MKVNGSAPTGAAAPTSRPARDTEGGFAPSGVADSARAAAAGRPGSLAPTTSMDMLLALQEELTPKEKRRRALRRGHSILDALDALKLATFEPEGMDAGVLRGLQEAVRSARDETEDGELNELLDQIELRAAVELAKRERNGLTA
jgi:hypothetical protein